MIRIDSRAAATGPAGPAAAGPMFGRIHKFSTTAFDPDRFGLNAVGVARIFGPHVRLLCKMHEIW